MSGRVWHPVDNGEALREVRRGSAYVFFLTSATLITLIGLSAMSVVRAKTRAVNGAVDRMAARMASQSAVEQALAVISSRSDWRTAVAHNAWSTEQALGSAWIRWKLVDEVNGNLTVARNARVRVYGRGRAGDAVWVMSALYQPAEQVAPQNLIGNWGFELGTTGWVARGGSSLQSSVVGAHTGARSLRVFNRSTGSGAAQSVTLTPGMTYQLSAWVRVVGGTADASIGVVLVSGGSSQVMEVATASVGSSWVNVTGLVTIPSEPSLTGAQWVVWTSGTLEFNVDGARLAARIHGVGIVPGTWRREPE